MGVANTWWAAAFGRGVSGRVARQRVERVSFLRVLLSRVLADNITSRNDYFRLITKFVSVDLLRSIAGPVANDTFDVAMEPGGGLGCLSSTDLAVSTLIGQRRIVCPRCHRSGRLARIGVGDVALHYGVRLSATLVEGADRIGRVGGVLKLVLGDCLLEVQLGSLRSAVRSEFDCEDAAVLELYVKDVGSAASQHPSYFGAKVVVREICGALVAVGVPCLVATQSTDQRLDMIEPFIAGAEAFDYVCSAEHEVLPDASGQLRAAVGLRGRLRDSLVIGDRVR